MSPRGKRVEASVLRLQALYSILELARAAGVHRHVMRRVLKVHRVEVIWNGHKAMVPLSEVQKKMPLLWQSIKAAEKARYEASRANEPVLVR